MANRVRDLAKERWWREAVKRFVRSGLGVRAFCRREGLTESAFYFWRRELDRRDGEELSRDTSPRPPSARHVAGRPDFLPVRVTDAAASHASIALELAGGRVLRLPEAIPAVRVAEIVAAIEATDDRVDRGAAEVGR